LIARPFLLRRLRELHVIDADVEEALHRDGIVTLADLELAIAERRPPVAPLPLQSAAAALRREIRPLTLGRAWDLVTPLISAIDGQCPEIQDLQVSGDLRRSEPLVYGLILVGCAPDPALAVQRIAALPLGSALLHRTGRRLVFLFEGQEVDLRLGPADEFGTLLFRTTGPAAHVVDVLKRRGPRLARSEADSYFQAGLAFLPPETRDAPDALARAASGSVPRLVERSDIRGDLHMHTTYSDGRDTLRQMVYAARALGYDYIAVTDHSENASASRTLTLEQIPRQRDEIQRLREEVPDMAILHGLEVDILGDGALDCPDAILATFDIVLASLHEDLGHDGSRLTRRCLAAIRHPLVNAISHPANQLVGRRPGYDMDYEALFAAAAETGTALEVDGGPAHLDLSGERARAAVAAGVTLVIDSDCHRSPALERQMRMGVGTARRGWVEARHVLNTRRLQEVVAFFARKRAR
jgi:DNA polymerase (family 10)